MKKDLHFSEAEGKRKFIFQKYPGFFYGLVAVCGILFILVSIEFIFWCFLRFPQMNIMFRFMTPMVKNIYMKYDRDIVQFLPECARYDSILTYTLKPGACVVKNREFENIFQINSQGLRDDEESLHQPEIIVVGDSYAMGWGVNQNQAFAQLLEKLTAKKILNAAISSYGTVREMMVLDRLDLSSMKYLVIQYGGNDYFENRSYIDHNFHLEISSRGDMEATFHNHKNRLKYYPLLYLKTSLEFFFFSDSDNKLTQPENEKAQAGLERKILRAGMEATSNENEEDIRSLEAKYFLEVLLHKQEQLHNFQLIVFNLTVYNPDGSEFENNVRNFLDSADYPAFMKNMIFIRPELFLENDFYIIDEHINANGHLKVAEALNKAISTNTQR